MSIAETLHRAAFELSNMCAKKIDELARIAIEMGYSHQRMQIWENRDNVRISENETVVRKFGLHYDEKQLGPTYGVVVRNGRVFQLRVLEAGSWQLSN